MDAATLLDRTARGDVYRLVLESLEDGVSLVDASGRIVYWNEGAERITGYLRQDIIGRANGNSLLVYCSDAGFAFRDEHCPGSATLADGRSRRLDAFLKHQLGQDVPGEYTEEMLREYPDLKGIVKILPTSPGLKLS